MRRSELTRLVRRGECEKLDFKSRLNLGTKDEKATLVRHVLAVVNTPGDVGYLLFGMDDDGNETGLLDSTIGEERIQRVIREYCDPYVTSAYKLVRYRSADVGVLTVRREAQKLPYHPGRDAGAGKAQVHRRDIFIRHGRHSELATVDEVQALMREGDAARFALQRRLRLIGLADEYRFLSGGERHSRMLRDLRDVCQELELLPTKLVDKGLRPNLYVETKVGRKPLGVFVRVLFRDPTKWDVAEATIPMTWEPSDYVANIPKRLVHVVLVYPGVRVAPIRNLGAAWHGVRNLVLIKEGDNCFYRSRRKSLSVSIPVLWIGHVSGKEIMKRKLGDGMSWIGENQADIWR